MNQLTELRNIIVGEQQEELLLLRNRLEEARMDSTKLAEILPEALELSSSGSGEFVTKMSFKAIQDDPHGFAEVLFPALVPAISLMITSSTKALTRRINTTIESTTTAQGLKWRMEALRTGESYSDVVVRKTLDYRVEQLFLLKPDSGILIEYLVNEDIGSLDSDAIAAMFSAIQSFVNDSFNSDEHDRLNQISVGDVNVWLVHRPGVTLACVVRGSIPFELRDKLDAVQDEIFSRFAPKIKDFDGSQSSILGIKELLEPCLQLKMKSEYQNENKKSAIGSFVLLFCMIALLGFWIFSGFQKAKMRDDVENLLFVTPGIVTTAVEWKGGKLRVSGIQEAGAEIPFEKLKKQNIDIEKIDFSIKTFNSFHSKNKN